MAFSHRLKCFLRLWLFKCLASVYFFYRWLFRTPSPRNRPTLVKQYPCRPMLKTHIFYPPEYRPGEQRALYINIHGGGFAVADAQVDDPFCAAWAERTGMLVVSLDYRKVPRYPYPVPVYDVAAQVQEVLEDQSLPIDRSRVTIGGFSAGGHLALAVSQLPPLHGLVQAAVVYYPIVDFSHPPPEKMATRPYTDGPRDNLGDTGMGWALEWGIVPVGQNRRDPVLSPCYAKAEDLPPRIYMVAAQWDMLRLETQEMIHRLAGLDGKEDQEEPFDTGAYKWTLAKGCTHGFTHGQGGSPAEKAYRKEFCRDLYRQAHEWLKSGGLA
ncbi:alpha/beta-hydrolase [Aspergillus sclerotiicarbonarius CBS 121057]|uniref:Alpha/beta-hydrolase n=1 Tax=Aspergillus sclerotiicarbonarius (strain CBS 121057 / IBT 28362) TaxID=1448318 RepID=A0A319DW62_ASPSB|nr:alpha/beta-hydrolase [Aspergillus sclerotiicarbonarius CBS 121057]